MIVFQLRSNAIKPLDPTASWHTHPLPDGDGIWVKESGVPLYLIDTKNRVQVYTYTTEGAR